MEFVIYFHLDINTNLSITLRNYQEKQKDRLKMRYNSCARKIKFITRALSQLPLKSYKSNSRPLGCRLAESRLLEEHAIDSLLATGLHIQGNCTNKSGIMSYCIRSL